METSTVDLGTVITAAHDLRLERERSKRPEPKPRTYSYASEYHPCTRNLALKMSQPETANPPGTQALRRFHRGNQRQADIEIDLREAGKHADPPFIVVAGEEPFKITNPKGEVVISGRIDLSIEREKERSPVEIKSWPMTGQSIFTVDDLARSPWTRGAEMQIGVGLYARALVEGKSNKVGYLLIDLPGEYRMVRVSLEERFDAVDRFVKDSEAAQAHVLAGTLPPYIQNPAECRRCPFFGRSCNPPLDFGPGAQIFTDEDLLSQLADRQAALEAHRRYEAADKQVKERLRGIPFGLAGDFLIEGKGGLRRMKATEAHDVETWTTKITPITQKGEAE